MSAGNIKFTIIVLLTMVSISSYSQELFIVHSHRHYVKTTYESFRHNSFVSSLKKINDYFCDNKLDKYWVYDKRFWPKRRFPVSRCGSKKLISEWGDISHSSYKFHFGTTVVLTGIYFGNCVSTTYRSIRHRFINDASKKELNVHLPLSATIGYYGTNYSAEGITKIINNSHFLKTHNLTTDDKRSYEVEIYVNGDFAKEIKANSNRQAKIIRLYFWSNEDLLLKNL